MAWYFRIPHTRANYLKGDVQNMLKLTTLIKHPGLPADQLKSPGIPGTEM